MSLEPLQDYADSGLSIQYAMLDQYKKIPDKNLRPEYIIWRGQQIKTADKLYVPKWGRIEAKFLSTNTDVRQGFDIKVNGWIELIDGIKVSLLRTWNDPECEPVVEYSFFSKDGIISIWNVFTKEFNGGVIAEKWTGNAGFWVELINSDERIYHCSHGTAVIPDFESLVFKIKIQHFPGN